MKERPVSDLPTPASRLAPAGRIMIADDDEPFRRSTARLLEAAGYVCVEAASAGQARAELQGGAVDLVVADINMPGNCDLELIAGGLGDVPVVLVTGRPTIDTAARAVEARVVGYLIKPFAIERLTELAQKEIRARRVSRFIRKRRERAEQLVAQMKTLEQAAATMAGGSNEQELQAYLAMFSENVVVGLSDWMEFAGAAAGPDGGEKQRVAEARPFQLIEVLRDTVRVLERTKTQFKSKDLAELRQRLEAVLSPPTLCAASGPGGGGAGRIGLRAGWIN